MADSKFGRSLKMTPDDVYSFVRDYIRKTGTPVVTTTDITEQFECSKHTARDRLQTLVDRGDLEVKKVGRNRAYYLRG